MSSSPENLLQAGAQAMQQARFQDAIEPLEAFCKGAINRRSKQFFQAQMWLVQAYQKSGQDLHAIALCEQLIKSDIPQVQQWGQKVLPKLLKETPQPETLPSEASQSKAPQPADQPAAETAPEAAPDTDAKADTPPSFLQVIELLPPDEAAELFATGRKALQQRRYDEAAAALEAFVHGSDSSYSNYSWACTSLGKAYRGSNQLDKALTLCQYLHQSDQESLRAWARDFFKTLDIPDKELVPTPVAGAAAQSSSAAADLVHSAVTPLPSEAESARVLAASAKRTKPLSHAQEQDLTPQILSALAHGSISWLASLLIFLLFQESILAQLLGLLRFLIPLVILLNTQHEVVKANAKEALNFVITSLILIVASIPVGLLLIPIAFASPALLILLIIPLLGYGLMLAIWPVVATVLCARDRKRTFRYPSWLILHLI
jgi:tetratricopeptide (TPR) repeat protein